MEHCASALTVQWPALLMAPSSRWLFPWLDEMRKPWQASEKSHAINLTLWRILCPAYWCRGMALTIPCRH